MSLMEPINQFGHQSDKHQRLAAVPVMLGTTQTGPGNQQRNPIFINQHVCAAGAASGGRVPQEPTPQQSRLKTPPHISCFVVIWFSIFISLPSDTV